MNALPVWEGEEAPRGVLASGMAWGGTPADLYLDHGGRRLVVRVEETGWRTAVYVMDLGPSPSDGFEVTRGHSLAEVRAAGRMSWRRRLSPSRIFDVLVKGKVRGL